MLLHADISFKVSKSAWGLAIIWNNRWRSLTLYKNWKPVFNAATKDPAGFRGTEHLKHCWFGGLLEWEFNK